MTLSEGARNPTTLPGSCITFFTKSPNRCPILDHVFGIRVLFSTTFLSFNLGVVEMRPSKRVRRNSFCQVSEELSYSRSPFWNLCAIFDHAFEFEPGGARNAAIKPVLVFASRSHFS